ncbi:MAG: adenylate/guanylate cyclase domain-containing protein [Ignavibacteria bacterium]|nr:adenylate/guanylate cyclase domain-containing protein [Ignavibacteria bacterium]
MKLKSKKVLSRIITANLLITFSVSLLFILFDIPWNILDYKLNDYFYKKIVEEKKGPSSNDKVVYLNITDASYNFFGSNTLSRESLAKLNRSVSGLNPESVFYDIIFPRSSRDTHDSLFAFSIKELGNVYLPTGFLLQESPWVFRWEPGVFFEQLHNKYLKKPGENGDAEPYYAVWALSQKDEFAESAVNSGHISVVIDEDGILRHFPLIIKVDSLYFPAISLSIFLDYNEVPFEKVKINWGENIIIPALQESYLDEDVVIPIDDHGNVFIPYYGFWSDGSSKMMEVQNLIKYSDKPEYLDDLLDFYEGSFVFISDISVGTSDLGQTTIEENVPLVTVHAALLNGMLNNQFYTRWDIFPLAVIIFISGVLLILTALPRTNLIFYFTALLLISLILYFGYNQLLSFNLFPSFSVSVSLLLIFIGMMVSIQVITAKDRAFIKNAFTRYVPDKVVENLIDNPEQLKLGGEERELTILFSDIAGFTSISEKMKPSDLVSLLNEYLTEMTRIIIEKEGTIDKYIGDAILAEFGAPVMIEHHAAAAVASAIIMQKRLTELNKAWKERGYPLIMNRTGINTGNVIIGNMGSDQVFDYTVIGDHVNLAARLESANKFYNTKILISEYTYKLINNSLYHTRLLDLIKVKGKENAVKVYEVTGFISDPLSEEDLKYYDLYERGFNFYLHKKFDESKEYFNKALQIRPNDYSSDELIKRIDKLNFATLDESWDGSITYKEK